jgi:hypothetical protein
MVLPRPTRPINTALVKKEKKIEYRPSDIFRFEPKKDITAYELAYLISQFWTIDVSYERFFQFTETLQSHFIPVTE